MSDTPNKLAALRAQMTQHRIDAYLLPSADPHQSEYVAARWSTRSWLSGFTGSAGTLVVNQEAAGLWTDSRYFLQAETQLENSGISLQKQRIPHAPEHVDWLAEHLESGSRLGFDGQVVSLAQFRLLQQKLIPQGIRLVGRHDLADAIWQDRPPLPASELFELPVEFAGESRTQKIERIRAWLKDKGADAVLLVALDDIAWTLNIRASDVEFNPVCLSYLLVERKRVQWFVGKQRVPKPLRQAMDKEGIEIRKYEAIDKRLRKFKASRTLAVDPSTLSFQFYEALAGKQLLEHASPVQAMKAVKNSVEISQIRKAMRKDGVALLRLFSWLEQTLQERSVPEVEVAERLAEFRSQSGHYHGESFAAIVGYKGNGAIIHYRAEPATCASLENEGMLLLDSGGQYWEGTTDITRTITLGDPTMEQRRHFTLVLKGMIALSEARFPAGTGGAQLDTLARQFLWQDGLNYGHGTGHGVGHFLNVHEGPQGFAISAVTSRGRTAFQSGMLTSNEPGFYRTGEYGIRIENLILCVEDEQTDYGNFLRFETLTLFPIDRRLIQLDMLTPAEIDWLNNYHTRVHEELGPLLQPDELRWLHNQCRPL